MEETLSGFDEALQEVKNLSSTNTSKIEKIEKELCACRSTMAKICESNKFLHLKVDSLLKSNQRNTSKTILPKPSNAPFRDNSELDFFGKFPISSVNSVTSSGKNVCLAGVQGWLSLALEPENDFYFSNKFAIKFIESVQKLLKDDLPSLFAAKQDGTIVENDSITKILAALEDKIERFNVHIERGIEEFTSSEIKVLAKIKSLRRTIMNRFKDTERLHFGSALEGFIKTCFEYRCLVGSNDADAGAISVGNYKKNEKLWNACKYLFCEISPNAR